jgi:hypothetical protein
MTRRYSLSVLQTMYSVIRKKDVAGSDRGLILYIIPKFWDIAVGIVTRLQAGWPRNRGSTPGRRKGIFSNVSRPSLRPTKSFVQWAQQSLPSGIIFEGEVRSRSRRECTFKI